MSDVLMINMWAHDIGKYNAAGLGLLRVVFQVNLRLFEKKSHKKILFVIRDTDTDHLDLEIEKKNLYTSFEGIWDDITKPL